MKKQMGRIVLIATLITSIFIVTNAFADSIEGVITDITYAPNAVTVDDSVVVNGIRIKYLANQYNVDLAVGDIVSIDYYVFECSDGSLKNMATAITIDDITVRLR